MRLTVVLLAMIASAIPALGGVVFEIETKNHQGGEIHQTQLWADQGNIKLGIAPRNEGRGQGSMVFQGEQRQMIVVDKENSTYFVIDDQTMQAISAQLSAAQTEMERVLKELPDEQRTAIEQAMSQRMPAQEPKQPRAELENTGERAVKNGYPCVKYILREDDRTSQEFWVSDWSNIDGGREIGDTFGKMADFFSEMLDSIPKVGAGMDFGDHSWEHMKELGGFPVVTRTFDEDGSLEDETTLRSAKRQVLDPDTFEPPAGYRRMALFSP